MKIEIQIPTNLSEVSLLKYQDFQEVLTSNDGDVSDEFVTHKIVSIFCGIKLSQVGLMKYTSIVEVVNHFTNLFNKKHKFVPKFSIGGQEFGFIPNLESITMDEFVDLDLCLSDWSKMHQAMAVLYRPITKRKGEMYDIEPYNNQINYSDLMKHAPLDIVFGATVFFWNLKHDLLVSTLTYLEEQLTKMNLPNGSNSTQDGDGTTHSINLVKATLEDLKTLEIFLPVYASHSYPTNTKETKLNATK